MSICPSFLHASQQLTDWGYKHLGASLGGVADRNYWISFDDGAVVEGREIFGDSLQRYLLTTTCAEDALFPALIGILRSQHPEWTRPECEERAVRWSALLGFAPQLNEAA